MRRWAVAALIVLSGLVITGPSLAFCRTSVCDLGVGTRCTPARDGDCGVPLRWKERCIGFSMQSDGSRSFDPELLAELMSEAFDTWNSADCNPGRPHFLLKRQADAFCAAPEYNVDFDVDKGNANVVIFHDDEWPHPTLESALALTTVTYDADTGEIYDADIEINTFGIEFTTSDTDVTYDLLTTLQHETGHFLGIAHSPEPDAAMHEMPSYGTTARRALSEDDVAAVCEAYPPEEAELAASCSPMPHDFSPHCARTLSPKFDLEPAGGCSTPPAPPPGGAPLLAAAIAGAWSLRLRRRRA